MSKIDYEITVDVTGADIETKRRVQNAFCKLGIKAMTPDGYCDLDKDGYTNTDNNGRITNYIMYVVGRQLIPTHTIEELMKLASMKTKTDLKPFDLEKALAGEPVVLRNGEKAYVRYHEKEFETAYPLIGYTVYEAVGRGVSWTVEGNFLADKEESERDIVGMWSEPLVFNHWDLLCEDIKYLAKGKIGKWYGYSRKPVREDEEWYLDGTVESTRILNPKLFPECDWKNSRIKRPEK